MHSIEIEGELLSLHTVWAAETQRCDVSEIDAVLYGIGGGIPALCRCDRKIFATSLANTTQSFLQCAQ